jgi:murein DD-endopeptidase MepM/ murein hydrolase activator NlpD
MQLIWVSGPTARVLTLSIKRQKVLMALALIAGALLLLGGLFQLIGLRVAVEHVPSLAQKMGGVASLQDQQRMEAMYKEQLDKLQGQLAQTVQQLQQLENSRQSFFSRVGLGALAQPVSSNGGRGGPFRLPSLWPAAQESLSDRLSLAFDQFEGVQRSVDSAQKQWQGQQSRLEALPLALPLQQDFLLTSNFGVRSDPLTHLPSMHEGIDFVAPVGTPVLATAAGQVVQARFNGAYGNMVDVAHAEGFVTRYAHLQTILVQPGQRLRAGDRLGLLGNTGRSTGPHLHYEVLYRGRAMHPIQAVQAWSRS